MTWLRVMLCAFAALMMAAVGFGMPPTPQQALEHAKAVVLVRRVVKDNQIHAYVKEVWRAGPNAGTPPRVGSEYRDPMPYDSRMRFPERDEIVFDFGEDRPKGFPVRWRIQVTEDGIVLPFQMDVDGVRMAVKKTKT